MMNEESEKQISYNEKQPLIQPSIQTNIPNFNTPNKQSGSIQDIDKNKEKAKFIKFSVIIGIICIVSTCLCLGVIIVIILIANSVASKKDITKCCIYGNHISSVTQCGTDECPPSLEDHSLVFEKRGGITNCLQECDIKKLMVLCCVYDDNTKLCPKDIKNITCSSREKKHNLRSFREIGTDCDNSCFVHNRCCHYKSQIGTGKGKECGDFKTQGDCPEMELFNLISSESVDFCDQCQLTVK